jgi:hypothetical protein
MKHLKTYKLFEELELLDRGYSDNLQDEFKSDISDICLDLNDIYPLSISFDDSKYRSSNLFRHIGNNPGNQKGTTKERDDYWEADYPSITISREGRFRGIESKLPFKTGKGSSPFNKKLIEDWNKECLSVAYRIKRYLGDNFLLFTIEDKGDERSFELDDNTTPKSLDAFPRFNIETLRQGDIKCFRIIYNPDSYKKEKIFNESVNWSPEEIINELTWGLKDAGLQVNVYSGKYIKHRRVSANHPRFEGELHVEITDNDKVFCKNYPEDDMDWLYGKPVIMNFFDELTDFGLIRDKDYKVYGGGLNVNLVFQKEGIDKVKL